MAILLLSQLGDYIGLSHIRVKQLAAQGRIAPIIELKPKIRIVDTATVKVLPPINRVRRFDGPVIGRSKPLRGEPGFKEVSSVFKPKRKKK